MYRGTTPTITINCDIDVSEFVTMWVTFRTQQLATYAPPKQVEVTKHLGDEGVDATDKVVTVSLTQADTLLLGSLSPDEDQQVEVQIRGRMEDGRAFASNIMTAPAPASMTASMKETGGGSASNYEALRNKPKINGHELIGDMTPAQLGITDDRHHTHKQAQAAKVWTIAHNLGKRPAVTVVDSAGTVVIGEVDYLDDNTVRLTFCAAFSGTAYFN